MLPSSALFVADPLPLKEGGSVGALGDKVLNMLENVPFEQIFKINLNHFRGRIFSHVRAFCEQAVSDLYP